MPKTYFNDAIIGNSKLLGCLTKRGELVRLYWPYIDYAQQLDVMYTGINIDNTTYWTSEDFSPVMQYYENDTNILHTTVENTKLQMCVEQTDFVIPSEDIVARKFSIQNRSNKTISPKFISYFSSPKNMTNYPGVMVDTNEDVLVHYRFDNYLGITYGKPIDNFQLGECYDNAKSGVLSHNDNMVMWYKSATSMDIGDIAPYETKDIVLYVIMGGSLDDIFRLNNIIKRVSYEKLKSEAEEYWKKYIKDTKQYRCDNEQIKNLYNRSVLLFSLISDKNGGGVIASPEIDEEFSKCGRYGYCWGRDAGFISLAFAKCGLLELNDKFFEWCMTTQASDGSCHQRYYVNGDLAPGWGMQIDEPGTILFGIWRHYETTGNKDFLNKMSCYVRRTVEFLLNFLDENNLPKMSYDLWEERKGVHAYSSAGVYSGLKSAIKILDELGLNPTLRNRCEKASERIKEAIEQTFWSNDLGRFKRSVNLNERWKEDVIDVSLIGLAIPFGVFDLDDERIIKTVEKIEKELLSEKVGGIKRYTDDNYIGGNPWIICTLWVALYYAKRKIFDKAEHYLKWVVDHTTDLGFLPEQIDKETGEPAWVMQLTWSHAMFVLVVAELANR